MSGLRFMVFDMVEGRYMAPGSCSGIAWSSDQGEACAMSLEAATAQQRIAKDSEGHDRIVLVAVEDDLRQVWTVILSLAGLPESDNCERYRVFSTRGQAGALAQRVQREVNRLSNEAQPGEVIRVF